MHQEVQSMTYARLWGLKQLARPLQEIIKLREDASRKGEVGAREPNSIAFFV